MSFGNTTSKSKVELPKWLEKGGKDAAKSAIKFYGKPFKPFKGDRVAGFNDTQNNAFAAIGDWANKPSTVIPEAIGIAKDSAVAPAYSMGPVAGAYETTDFGRIVDEDGPLGSMSDYINPYISQALNPAIRDIDRAAAQERLRIGDAASNANAFGDARHGIREGMADRNRVEAIGDTAYGAYADAWTQAMGARSGDLSRMTARDFQQGQFDEAAANRALSADVQQGQFNEAANNRGLTGAALMSEIDTTGQSNELQKLMTLLSSGNLQQQNSQSELDAAYEKWGLKQQDRYDKIAALVSVLNGVPYSRTTTTSQPDNSWASLVGAGVGAFL